MGKKLTTCKSCGKEIAKSAKRCVHCGADQRPSIYKIMAVMAALFIIVVVWGAMGSSNQPSSATTIQYDINNLSNMYIGNDTFEQLYERAKNAALAWIDELDESDYLGPDTCSLTVFDDGSAAFLLRTVEKPGVKDNTVLVTFNYTSGEKDWQRSEIVYNNKSYGDNK